MDTNVVVQTNLLTNSPFSTSVAPWFPYEIV